MDDNHQIEKETRIALGGDLRISRAGEVFGMLDSATMATEVVVIDGSEVGKIDAAGLQALAAAIIRLHAANARWRWENRSATLTDAAKLLGLEEALQ